MSKKLPSEFLGQCGRIIEKQHTRLSAAIDNSDSHSSAAVRHKSQESYEGSALRRADTLADPLQKSFRSQNCCLRNGTYRDFYSPITSEGELWGAISRLAAINNALFPLPRPPCSRTGPCAINFRMILLSCWENL